MKIITAPFDAADYLTDDETVAEYISAALEDPDPDMFLVAVKTVARARGMAQLGTYPQCWLPPVDRCWPTDRLRRL